MDNKTLLLLEYKVNCILHILQDLQGIRVNPIDDSKNACAVCYGAVEYVPILNGQIVRKCSCKLPVDSVDISTYDKEKK
jgi:hypothetical protein